MRHIYRMTLALVIVFGTGALGHRSVAQEATPAAECPTLTEAEVIQLVESYFTATEADDEATIEEILAEDVVHNSTLQTSGAENQPGNADEIALHNAAGPQDFTIDEIFGDEDQAAVRFTVSLGGGAISVSGIAIFKIECGEVSEIFQESTALGAALAGAAGGATPAATT